MSCRGAAAPLAFRLTRVTTVPASSAARALDPMPTQATLCDRCKRAPATVQVWVRPGNGVRRRGVYCRACFEALVQAGVVFMWGSAGLSRRLR